MKKLAFCLILVLSIWGCTQKYEQINVGSSAQSQKLKSDGSVYILIPENGKYGTHSYPGTGYATARTIRAAFEKHVNRVALSPDVESVDLGLIKARNQEFTYLVQPMILYWEDRALQMGGKADRVELKIIVMDVESKAIIDSVVIKGETTWFSLGGDNTQDLLPKPIDYYVASLF